ncbi:uncharacterized protein LOC130653623 isoform X3 [Hydractinia symbiolongicarpus]|uniref:uncharacterized protein LOC130653623 isoform X3 n=1 Tax=Hydractinia symbiolongicarpus TaxID=13093 RepID=UPI00254D3931|nr:uncharacterized protein LOC130653623 isoform X3 [Hydractinia symbiolongicarpus]
MPLMKGWIYVLFLLCLFTVVKSDDDQPEEKDPWDKSTDKYVHKDGNDGREDLKVDVTEESESEVHSEKSKVEKIEQSKAKEKVDSETKDQFEDATDETDPANDIGPTTENSQAKKTSRKGNKKQHLSKKQFNYHGDFYPGSLWEYPYPYYHPQYGCGSPIDCPCNKADKEEPKEEAKEDEPDVPALKPPKTKRKQLVPTHYYGPPSAGWGGFQPGHTGGGWGAPYWYKKSNPSKKHRQHSGRQLVPTHYYGPPSAGWGGFQPGHTGGGWGAPYWYKSSVSKPHKTKIIKSQRGSRKYIVAGNDHLGIGHTGNGGWDSGLGNGFGHSWGAPNLYGAGPLAVAEGGPHGVDYSAWHGPDSFGSHGWGGHAWLGDYGGMHGDVEGERGFGSSFSGWGGAGGDMHHLDQQIGDPAFEDLGHANLLHHPGTGHMGHNSFAQSIGYGLRHGYKSKVPFERVAVVANQPYENETPSLVPASEYVKGGTDEENDDNDKTLMQSLDKSESKISKYIEKSLKNVDTVRKGGDTKRKTVNTRAANEKPTTQ